MQQEPAQVTRTAKLGKPAAALREAAREYLGTPKYIPS